MMLMSSTPTLTVTIPPGFDNTFQCVGGSPPVGYVLGGKSALEAAAQASSSKSAHGKSVSSFVVPPYDPNQATNGTCPIGLTNYPQCNLVSDLLCLRVGVVGG